MAESQNHMDLVKIAYNFITSLVPENKKSLIQYDSPTTSRPTKVIGGFIPDVFFWNGDLLVIGEAKTLKDFDNKHSKKQIESYYKECAKFYGESFLVISVPWQLVFSVKNYIRSIRNGIPGTLSVVVINEFGWRYEI